MIQEEIKKKIKERERERTPTVNRGKDDASTVDASSIDQKNPPGHLRGTIVLLSSRDTLALAYQRNWKIHLQRKSILSNALAPLVIFPCDEIALSKRRAEGCIDTRRGAGEGDDIKGHSSLINRRLSMISGLPLN